MDYLTSRMCLWLMHKKGLGEQAKECEDAAELRSWFWQLINWDSRTRGFGNRVTLDEFIDAATEAIDWQAILDTIKLE